MIKKEEFYIIKKRVEEERKFIQVIMGPRQVGKTTTVRQVMQNLDKPFHFVAADGVANSNFLWIEQQWETARFILKNQNATECILIIDEIQKIDNWAEIVKAEWDRDTLNGLNIKVVLLGSARLLLQAGLSESLAGRFEIIQMTHWSFSEMQQAFDFTAEEFVWFGGYPGAATLIEEEDRWRDYILNSIMETTISKDILMLTRIDKPAILRRLFELGANCSGQIVSLTKILGQLQDVGNTTTLSHYVNLLDSAGLLCGIERYSTEMIPKRASIPKWQVQNSAFSSVLSGLGFQSALGKPEIWGRHVETAIGVHLARASRLQGVKVYYWREGNFEVDFVIQYRNKTLGLEVKSGKTQSSKGILKFKQQVKPDKVLLIGNSGIPWQDFLKAEIKDLF
ncbi:MAG: ATP-binding protein [Bacteroidetes bacterium]|nr:ATP-binding protein [Bacteroidota bacterium]